MMDAGRDEAAPSPGLQHFCTYFDRNYLTRGLALYASLKLHCREPFVLWVVCFDEESYERLTGLRLPGMRLIRRQEFEADDEGLAKARTDRSSVEYFWTCTPSVMLFVLGREPAIQAITYLDADLYFFSDPRPIFEEFANGSILIVGHRYSQEYTHFEVSAGIYNVGLMVFRRDSDGLGCLRWWRDKCIEWCFARFEDGKFGDQKYLDDWPSRFPNVIVSGHLGSGVAPWNLSRYRMRLGDEGISVNGQPLIFYHFHGLKIASPNAVIPSEQVYRITAWQLRHLYFPYVERLQEATCLSGMKFEDSFMPASRAGSLLAGFLNQKYFLIEPQWLSLLLWRAGAQGRNALVHFEAGKKCLESGDMRSGRRHILIATLQGPLLLLQRNFLSTAAKAVMGSARVAQVRSFLGRIKRGGLHKMSQIGVEGAALNSGMRRAKNLYLYYGALGKEERQYGIGNFIGLTLHPQHEREIKHDALDRLPFPDGAVQKIQVQDVFEHLPRERIPSVLDEIYRVLASEGVFRLSMPDYRSPLLKKRSVYDSTGRILADLMVGGTVSYDADTEGVVPRFTSDGNAHVWFPTYEGVLELIANSTIRFCSEIRFYHYFIDDVRYVCDPFPENEMHVMRAPPYDDRAGGKPISIVVDFRK